jgi:hypothetical protein
MKFTNNKKYNEIFVAKHIFIAIIHHFVEIHMKFLI